MNQSGNYFFYFYEAKFRLELIYLIGFLRPIEVSIATASIHCWIQCFYLSHRLSGLDSASSFQCVSLLKKLAQEGRTIICVIHQPSSSILDMIDQLYLLAEGQCIYQGPIMDVTHFIFQATGLRCPSYHSSVSYNKRSQYENEMM